MGAGLCDGKRIHVCAKTNGTISRPRPQNSNDAGAFVLRGVDEGVYRLRAAATGYRGVDSLDFALGKAGVRARAGGN